MKAILMIADKELMIVEVPLNSLVYRIPFGPDLSKELLQALNNGKIPACSYIEFTHQGKYRLCECGHTKIPILELSDAKGR